MSREIKFRVRRKDGRLIGYIRFESGRWQCQMLKPAGGSEEWSSGVLHGPHMDQYIGINDRNDREVYERDIVTWGNHCDYCRERPVRVAEVQYGPDLVFASQVGDFHYGNFAYSDHESGALKHLEVIGNIYEQPELLASEAKQ
jgi:uncharacterized phage protein (TIGR01671 family)